MKHVFGLFPRLQEGVKNKSPERFLGGEQQMLAIGRALMGRPKLLLLDEPSLGLAPMLVKTIFEKIVEINREQGITFCLSNKTQTLRLEFPISATFLETGEIILQGDSAALRQNPQVKSAYLGG